MPYVNKELEHKYVEQPLNLQKHNKRYSRLFNFFFNYSLPNTKKITDHNEYWKVDRKRRLDWFKAHRMNFVEVFFKLKALSKGFTLAELEKIIGILI